MGMYKKYSVDQLILSPFKVLISKELKKSKSNRLAPALVLSHTRLPLLWPGHNSDFGFWDKNPSLWEKLTKATYPFNEPIINCVIKIYYKGDSACLHTDDPKYHSHKKKYTKTFTNSVLLHQSEDLEGGDLVLAGDGWEPTHQQLQSRLVTMKHKTPGDAVVWDSDVIHGVSEIENGSRIVLIVIKGKDE